jgi:hypothetical protein
MSSGILHRVALIRTDASEKHIASLFRVIKLQVFLDRSEEMPPRRMWKRASFGGALAKDALHVHHGAYPLCELGIPRILST